MFGKKKMKAVEFLSQTAHLSGSYLQSFVIIYLCRFSQLIMKGKDIPLTVDSLHVPARMASYLCSRSSQAYTWGYSHNPGFQLRFRHHSDIVSLILEQRYVWLIKRQHLQLPAALFEIRLMPTLQETRVTHSEWMACL